jgi:hypothetical protein
MAGALVDGCLTMQFPGSKVGQMYYFYSFFFDWRLIFVVVDCELLHSTEYDYSFAMRLIPTVFFLLTRSGLIKILLGRTTANQALLCTSQLFLWV